jgi:Ca-activated chloride channel family protein
LPKSDRSALISTPIDRRIEYRALCRRAAGCALRDRRRRLCRAAARRTLQRVDDLRRCADASSARHAGPDDFGYRMEFVQLVRAAKSAGAMARLDR